MRIRKFIILSIALAGTLGFSLMLKNAIESKPSKAVIAQPVKPKPIEKVGVLVAKRDLPIGHKVTGQDIEWQDWPKELVPSGYITRNNRPSAKSELKDSIIRQSFIAKEPISLKKILVEGKSSIMSALLKPGMRAVSVPLSAVTGAGGFILPGDRVDVILTRRMSVQNLPALLEARATYAPDIKPQNDSAPHTITQSTEHTSPTQSASKNQDLSHIIEKNTSKDNNDNDEEKDITNHNKQKQAPELLAVDENYYAETVLTNIRILAIDQDIRDNSDARVGRTATLEVSQKQAEILALSQQIGELSLALIDYNSSLVQGNEQNGQEDIMLGTLAKSPEQLAAITAATNQTDTTDDVKTVSEGIKLFRGSGMSISGQKLIDIEQVSTESDPSQLSDRDNEADKTQTNTTAQNSPTLPNTIQREIHSSTGQHAR